MAQNASTGFPIIAKPIGRKQHLAACRILLICMIPKFVPRLPGWSNFGNGVSGAAFQLKVANNIPLPYRPQHESEYTCRGDLTHFDRDLKRCFGEELILSKSVWPPDLDTASGC